MQTIITLMIPEGDNCGGCNMLCGTHCKVYQVDLLVANGVVCKSPYCISLVASVLDSEPDKSVELAVKDIIGPTVALQYLYDQGPDSPDTLPEDAIESLHDILIMTSLEETMAEKRADLKRALSRYNPTTVVDLRAASRDYSNREFAEKEELILSRVCGMLRKQDLIQISLPDGSFRFKSERPDINFTFYLGSFEPRITINTMMAMTQYIAGGNRWRRLICGLLEELRLCGIYKVTFLADANNVLRWKLLKDIGCVEKGTKLIWQTDPPAIISTDIDTPE